MTRKLAVWGAGGMGRVVIDLVRLGDAYEVQGFIDDVDPGRQGERFCGAPVLGGREALEGLLGAGVRDIVIAVGDNPARSAIAAEVVRLGFSLVTLIHPHASVAADVPIGEGTVVKAMTVVEPGASVGANVILGALSYVGHDVVIEDDVHISAGGTVAGYSVVARGAWIGAGAILKPRVRVGEGTQIGAGAVVLGDIPAGVVATGDPAVPRWRPGLFGGGSR